MLQALFFDISGVLYEGQRAIAGAAKAVGRAQASPLQVRFLTNTSRKTRQRVHQDLLALGFELALSQIITAPSAAKAMIQAKGWRPFCLVHEKIRSEFDDLDQAQPNAVLVGDAAEGFSYPALDQAFRLCLEGAPLIGVGMNRYFKLEGQLHLDAGPFIRALEYAAGTEAIIVGKPAPAFFLEAVASVGVKPDQVMMVGDDVQGDVEGALSAGLQACLVQTGKYRLGDESGCRRRFPCVASVVEAVELALG
ncbi:TIGR01458 family HAD-type hydrolase [Ferrimonas sediminicola]|uniref:Haloacid dehalogenase-like hydrolase domain-containing protein 2 n=1 Tax=Ferrimonas sediminicola TaxID=2569538 RepID=A0A4U1BC10_9GAMM|nr:TIGR01458 family HAD-type hydrolase [Ferrimonas sediminicola]TKB48375.1 TIGR01458 family HAD-type hydrolase [Ferrimonas sediminicola]